MEKQLMPKPIDMKTKPSWFGRHFIHPANIAWQYCKGKKRYATIIVGMGASTAFLTGNIHLGALLAGVEALLSGTVLAEKTGEKLNQKTSGDKINWAEVVTAIIKILRSIFDKPKTKKEGKDNA